LGHREETRRQKEKTKASGKKKEVSDHIFRR